MKAHKYLQAIIVDELAAFREQFKESKLILILFIISIVALFIYLQPFTSRNISFATSYAGSDWQTYVEYLKPIMEEEGVSVSIVNTEGAVQNVLKLKSNIDPVNVAFTYGAALAKDQVKGVYSLGSVGYDPVWIFYKKNEVGNVSNFADLAKFKVGLGPKMSGSNIIAHKLFNIFDLDISKLDNFKSGSFADMEKKFTKGEVDILIVVSSINGPLVNRLLREEGVKLFDLKYAEAYQKVFNSFQVVKLPAASIDIRRQIPPKDISLIATTSSLVVRKDMHPDLQLLLLMSAKELLKNSSHLFFAKRNEFPAYVDPTIPLSPVASKFYDYGPPHAMKYLPFWIAGFFDRAWFLLLALLTIFYPISKLNVHFRKFRFSVLKRPYYEELLAIEYKLCNEEQSDQDKKLILERLDIINTFAIHHRVPVGDEADYFLFLNAINLLKLKLKFD